jgi:predicted nucleotidyltransferase component of viral defense system
MIPQRNLSLLSNRLARAGGRRVVEAVLERDYCLAWFLVGLSRSPLREALVFKGGTALKRCYFGDYRFSEALDFTLAEPLSSTRSSMGSSGCTPRSSGRRAS